MSRRLGRENILDGDPDSTDFYVKDRVLALDPYDLAGRRLRFTITL
jgi:hypothetical protein